MGERVFIAPPPSRSLTTGCYSNNGSPISAPPPSDGPHPGGVMPSRHRSENKQRRTAGNGAAFTGPRKYPAVGEDNQTAVNKNTLFRSWREAGRGPVDITTTRLLYVTEQNGVVSVKVSAQQSQSKLP